MNRRPLTTRTGLGMLLSLFVFVQIVVVGALAAPRRVYATGLPVVDILANGIKTGEIISDQIFQAIWDGLVGAVLTGATFFAQRLAYDMATELADAAAGKKPAFQDKSFGSYLDDAADNAVGEALNKLATDWVGLDICQPLDLRAGLAIQLGLRQAFTKPRAKCTWDQIGANWEQQWEKIKDQYGNCSGGATGAVGAASRAGRNASGNIEDCMLAVARDAFKPANTELGISVEATTKINTIVRNKELAATKEREEGGGFKPISDIITGNVKTPAPLVAKESEKLTSSEQEKKSFQLISGTMASGAKGALIGTLSIFANTFLSKLGQNVMQGLFETKPSTGGVALSPLGIPDGGAEIGVSPQVTALLTQTISVRDAGLYDVLSQFSACPSESGNLNRRPDECVIDTDFEAAVRSAESGDPLTIKQALEKDLLHASWKLIPSSLSGLNTSVDCRNQAYCYSNIAKLRQARILPLGFEIAASLSPPDDPWTLGEVVAGFNDCVQDNEGAVMLDRSPFCHLVDPNWILKAPLTRCRAEVPGPMLTMQDSNIRHNICVDKPTCLQDDGNGSCTSPWGYCVREKNVWRLNGDSCPAQFATCITYNGTSPGAAPNSSYLSRTVDFSACTERDVGCREYTTAQRAVAEADGTFAWENSPNVFLNGKAGVCTQPGCAQFVRQDGSSVYLKKAPSYLGCYDGNRDATIDWPDNAMELAQINGRSECKDYAPVCAKDEVGCTLYMPDNGDPDIPAIAGAGDVCANECVGYSTYKQMPTTFERAKFPLYFIPTTANQCSGAEVGCDQFVNAERGERAEYYSFVRQCEKPAPNNTNSAVFYAWEGSDAQGYQLRSYVLKRGPRMYREDPTDVTPVYAAAYDAARISSYHDICNADLYAQRLADPDCRELFDRAGNAYYRLLSKTITVSDECTTMRKTDADIYYAPRDVIANQAACTEAKGVWGQQGCQICEGGGALQNGVCLYAMIKSEASSCRAEASGCRAYTGNAGNNVRVAYQAKFDDLDTTGWSAGTLSAESVVVGGKSLRVDNRNVSLSMSSTPQAGSSYLMNFWAKGQGTLTVTFDRTDAEPSNRATFRLTGDWHQFSLGPVYVKSVEVGAAIAFSVDSDTPVFLDNVVIRETIDTVNVVKNSWQTPASCDANPQDNIPGEALGCQQYRDHNGTSQALKSFTRICRDVAVGCEKLTDTYNTPELDGKTYGVYCSTDAANGRQADFMDPVSRICYPRMDIDGDGQLDNDPEQGGDQVCTIPLGRTNCTFTVNRVLDRNNADDAAHIGSGTQIVSADSIAYLVNRQEFRCDQNQKGCMAQGEVTGQGANHKITAVSKINNPEKYNEMLCEAAVVGCEAYATNDIKGTRTVYFKDPSVTGKPVCEYRENVGGNSGWFRKGTNEPCYENYRSGSQFGVRSQGDPGYDGHVAVCQPTYHLCKEFRDPVDSSQLYPNGKPYYVVDNAKLDRASCNGQVSLQEGCVLFNDISDPTELWNASSTYKRSNARDGVLTAPAKLGRRDSLINCQEDMCIEVAGIAFPAGGWYGLGNCQTECRVGYERRKVGLNEQQAQCVCVEKTAANTILRVARDRACGEWLACQSAATVIDPTSNQPKLVCSSLALCDQFSAEAGGIEQCTNWADPPHEGLAFLDRWDFLTLGTGWYDMSYSGYSLFNQYQIPFMRFVRDGEGNTLLGAVPLSLNVAKDACDDKDEGATCRLGGRDGKCVGGVCAVPLSGAQTLAGPACRGYASDDAPFTFAEGDIDWENTGNRLTDIRHGFRTLDGFDNAAVCQRGESCMCSYKKVDYGRGEFVYYYDYDETSLAPGVCRGGYTNDAVSKDKTGRACTTNKDCLDDREEITDRERRDGECVPESSVSLRQGFIGYCLEPDLSLSTPGSGVRGAACLTWLPVDAVPGAASLENQYHAAGFQPSDYSGYGKYYCAESLANATQRNARDCKRWSMQAGEMSCSEYFAEGDMSYAAFINSYWESIEGVSDSVEAGGVEHGFPGLDNYTLDQIDYIELEFGNHRDSDQPYPGSVIHIVNELNRPRIYSFDDVDCLNVTKAAGWDESETVKPVCRTGELPFDWVERQEVFPPYSGIGGSGLSMVMQDGPFTHLGWMWSDNEADARSRTFGHIQNKSIFGRGYRIGSGGGEGGNASDGHVIWFTFDENGRMLPRVSLNIMDTNENGGIVSFTFRVVLREACRTVSQVALDDKNTAWTDRLWNPGVPAAQRFGGSLYATQGGGDPVNVTGRVVGGSAPAGTQLVAPYGSVSDPTADHLFIQRSTYDDAKQRERGGAKLTCRGGGRCSNQVFFQSAWRADTFRKGKEILRSLFGRVYRLIGSGQAWDDRRLVTGYAVTEPSACAAGSALDADNACFDVRSSLDMLYPPEVASVDSAHCSSGDIYAADTKCPLGRLGRFTIDSQDEGIVFGVGNKQAVTKFFAWADMNRGPIRNIIVDWDNNGVTAGSAIGKYQNRKPYCQSSDVEPVGTCRVGELGSSNMTCKTTAECQRNGLGECAANRVMFGNAPRACKEGYYQYVGAYKFDAADAHCNYRVGSRVHPEVADAELTRRGLRAGDRYCVFKPRVIVQDNWGWCNGTCQQQQGGFRYRGCWGDPDRPGQNICSSGRGEDNVPGRDNQIKVGTPFIGVVVVAERK